MSLELRETSGKVIGCAIAVHRELGPGFMEGIYVRALAIELRHAGIRFRCQVDHEVAYRRQEVGSLKLDLLVDDCLIVEVKAIADLADIHFAQTRSFLKAFDLKHALLLNFATMPLTIKRVIADQGARAR